MKPKSNFRAGLLSIATTITVALTALVAPSAYGVTETFSSAGTTNWICPPGVTSITVECWGGGGAGGGADTTTTGSNAGGGGGGGGAYAKLNAVSVTPGSTYSITIPEAATCPTSGFAHEERFDGSPVSFTGDSDTVTANGGQGGQCTIVTTEAATSGQPGLGGAVGVGFDAVWAGGAATFWAGGNGGGGGGGAGDLGDGGSPNAANASFGVGGSGSDANHTGGDGGASRNGASNGNDASSPGGGGGGAKATAASAASKRGGNGGLGRIILTFPDPVSQTKADNTTALNDGSSWVGSVVPTSTEVAKWDSTVTSANTTDLGADLTWAGISVVDPTGLVTINGTNTLTLGAAYRDIDMSAATADLALNAPVAMADDSVFPLNIWEVKAGRKLTLGGVVSGSFPLTIQGGGTTVLGAANTFSGAVTVVGGTLAFSDATALDNVSGITMSGGTTLRPDVTAATIIKPITVGATGTTTTINAPSTAISGSTPVPFTLDGKISGDGNVTFSGIQTANAYGTIILNKANDYAGSTLITATSASTNTEIFVKLAIENALPATTVLTLDGNNAATTSNRYCQLDLSGNNQTLAGLTNVARNATRVQRIVNSSGTDVTLTVANNSNYSYSGELGWTAGAGTAAYRNFGLTKSGTGVLTLNGANSYTGATIISGGTLAVGNLSALGNTPGITIADGVLRPTIDGLTLGVPITLGSTGTNATINAPATSTTTSATVETLTINSLISGDGDLTLNGSNGSNVYGTIILNSANDYTGATRIDCSTGGATCWVKNGIVNALPVTTVLTLDGGVGAGTGRVINYDLNGFDQTLAGLTNETGIDLRRQQLDNTGAAATLTVNNTADYTFGVEPAPGFYARMQGAISLVKSNVGTFTLANSQIYTGTTTIAGGTLALGTSNVLPNATPVSVGDASLAIGAGFTDTVGTLDVTGTANINLGDATSTLVFADSSGITWTGTLDITGTFVSGASLKFGSDANGLTATQLASITATGFSGFALDASGFLTASGGGGFSSWITGTFANGTVTNQGPNDDDDNDGISNLVEYAIDGQDPTVPNTSVGSFTANVLSFTKRAGTSGLTYAIEESTDLGITDAWAEVSGGSYVNDATTISYTLTPGTPVKNFTRLRVLSN